MEMLLPFAGFYCSEHDYEVDNAHDSLSMNEEGEKNEALWKFLFDKVSWCSVYRAYAKEYAEQIADKFGIKFTYKDMESPKEYNFTTDRIIVEIELAEVKRLFNETDKAVLAQHIKEKCTSRSGFISFYSNELDDWGPIADWDHNKLGILFEAWFATVHGELDESDVMEYARCNGKIEEWIFATMAPNDISTYEWMRAGMQKESD